MIKLTDILREVLEERADIGNTLINQYNDIYSHTPEEIVNAQVLSSEDDWYDHDDKLDAITKRINMTFDNGGFKNVPAIVYLYRVLVFDRDKTIDIDHAKVGTHFVSSPDHITNDFIDTVWGDYDPDEYRAVLLHCKVNRDEIDWGATVWHAIQYPEEKEFTLKDGANVQITDIEDFDDWY